MLETATKPPRWGLRLAGAAGMIALLYGVGAGIEAGLIEYVQRIVLLAGINVILAVALNLINGTTGQFSKVTRGSWPSARTVARSSACSSRRTCRVCSAPARWRTR